ncbi:crotonobetainyl-CoA--carnitine CoA-transferase [Tumebacillus avium]|uniref:Crotonobetainyl-CoA--carnitine CoA-transferase n=1 Tax=Tumebacillus avium TaxID=1903704 RepID=A0A1Y0IIX6_9BACL|nr:TylF/MycF/NovP-related O-methyltransferase [Tumebacillus avium]ARU60418.1 crotonobetainyl-CoA--carnitine CoA-transferase [Tumebacillus avium]
MSLDAYKVKSQSSQSELEKRGELHELLQASPIPQAELLNNTALYTRRQVLSNMLFMDHIYKQIIDVNGIIMEFGVRWGQNLALFESLRGIYEPFNHTRRIVGFDTFEGFPSVHEKDGTDQAVAKGALAVTEGYKDYLEAVLDYHEQESPLSHIKKYELVQGDATKTLEQYLKERPETIIAFAFFDFDIYEPTKKCLELIKPHLTKGSIIGFDQLNCQHYPGETVALKEAFGLDQVRLKRTPLSPYRSYFVIE